MKLEPPSPAPVGTPPKTSTFLNIFIWGFILIAMATVIAWLMLWTQGGSEAAKESETPPAGAVSSPR